jgi:hypothetical protein
MSFRASLQAFVILGLLSATGAAHGWDRSPAGAGKASSCVQAPRAAVDRCVATAPQTVVYGTLADHGPDYDARGNPLDRYGNVVAVPAGRSGAAREVFAEEPAFRQ